MGGGGGGNERGGYGTRFWPKTESRNFRHVLDNNRRMGSSASLFFNAHRPATQKQKRHSPRKSYRGGRCDKVLFAQRFAKDERWTRRANYLARSKTHDMPRAVEPAGGAPPHAHSDTPARKASTNVQLSFLIAFQRKRVFFSGKTTNRFVF